MAEESGEAMADERRPEPSGRGAAGWRRPVLLFLFAFVLRLGVLVSLRTWEFSAADGHAAAGWETGEIAANLAAGRGFSMTFSELSPTAWLAPLYPFWVSLVFRLLGPFSDASLASILVIQALLSSATVVLLDRFGRRVGGERVGLWAALGLALSPASINSSTRILWATTLCVFQIVLLLCWMAPRREPARRPVVLALGALAGIVLLTSPVPGLFLFALAGQTFGRRPGGLRAWALFLCVAGLVVAPWILRTRATLGAWVFVKSNFGNELFVGNHPGADGRYERSAEVAKRVLDPEALQEVFRLDEVARSKALGREARHWIGEHPRAFAELTVERIRMYWLDPFLSDWEKLPFGDPGILRRAYRAGQLLVLLLAGLGALVGFRKRGELLGVGLYLATVPLPYYVTHADITRYRFLVVPGVYLLAGIGFEWVRTRVPLRLPKARS